MMKPVAPTVQETAFGKMLKRKRTVQKHIREGNVGELQNKGIKVVQPF